MAQDKIIVRGARVHNLKNINVEIPRDKLVVITGLSGSGKSSLAFDTIFAEGQRRYVESLSAYARQFLGQMEKPDVDQIEGLSPAVSIDQKGSSHNPRSTVGTVTEIYDYLRLLFARIGVPHSPVTGLPLTSQTPQQIVDQLAALPAGTRLQLLAPLIKDRKGHHQQVLADVRKQGFARVRVDGEIRAVDEEITLDRYKLHTIEAVVDRLVVPPADESEDERRAFLSRLNDSVETALKLGDGFLTAMIQEPGEAGWRDVLFSEKRVDPATGKSYPDLEPKLFSFNSPQGACPECQGLGNKREIDPALVVPNPDLSLEEGAINAIGWNSDNDEAWGWKILRAACKAYGIPMDKPWRTLSKAQRDLILYGSGDGHRLRLHYVNRLGERRQYDVTFEGVIPNLARRYRESTSDYVKQSIEAVMSFRTCEACGGKRLKEEVLCVKVAGKNIAEVTDMSITQALAWVDSLGVLDEAKPADPRQNGHAPASPLSAREKQIARQIVKEIRARLQFLVDVGLDYLTLSRSANTLSGGEAQRIRLATQVGSQLTGVLYVLDEPTSACTSATSNG
jgi:excinuclease ABC subunit A